MREVGVTEWKQFMEGLVRGLLPELKQKNRKDGDDLIREYRQKGRLAARMRVIGGEVKPSAECERIFELKPSFISLTKHIYIPTQEEYEQWGDEENETNLDVTSREIAKREGREWFPPKRGPLP